MKNILLIFSLLTISITAQDNFPSFNKDEIARCIETRSEFFDGNGLWGYIDGGADIYLEYGFERLHVQEINFQGNNYKIEIYKMHDVLGAFGIFSINRYKCTEDNSLNFPNCFSRYQLQFSLDKYYISITNNGGTKSETEITGKIGKSLIKQITNPAPLQLPEFFSDSVLQPYLPNLKYIRGKLGIQNGLPEWENFLEGVSAYSLYYLPLTDTLGAIAYLNTDSSSTVHFFNSFGFKCSTAVQIYKGKSDQIIMKLLKPGEILIYQSPLGIDNSKYYMFIESR